MAPKKQKMALADFMADETTGKVDWADDFDDFAAAPMPKDDRGMPRRGGDWLASMPDRADRDRSAGGFGAGGARDMGASDRAAYPPREELPLPTQPPYTAFIGNLSFDVTEADVQDFFASITTNSVRLVSGSDGRPKGFGYVEFETLDGLKSGLARTGAQLTGRTVRVSVAEPREAKGPGFNSVAEEATQWRRAGPLPPQADTGARRGASDRPGFNRYESSGAGGGGFDNMDVGPGGGRSGFGSRFAPSAPREPREPRRAESLEPTAGDNASDWRTGKPPVASESANSPVSRRPSASPAGAAGEGGSRSFRRHGDATEIDEKYASQDRLGFGSKFSPTPPESPSVQKRPGFGFDRRNTNQGASGLSASGESGADTWRSARRASGQSPQQTPGSPNGTHAEPAQRKALNLKPRSTPVGGSDANAASVTSPTSGVSNPFGSARPVDATEREKEIEAKMAQREKERKEEERVRREKNKAEREKSLENAPTGPKADRPNKSRADLGAAKRADRSTGAGSGQSARSSPALAEKQTGTATPSANAATNGDSVTPTSPAATATTPKAPPPTGAWGGGRKPSGALVANAPASTEASQEHEQQSTKEASQTASADGVTDKAVQDVTKGVEAATLSA